MISQCEYMRLSDNVVEMFIGPFGSSLKNECFVSIENSYCMVYEQKHAIQKSMDVETRYVDEKKYNELKRFNIVGGDIIVSCRGTIGETYIVPDNAPLGIMHPSIMKIRLKEGVYNKQYFNLLLTKHLKDVESKANGSGIKMAVSAKELGDVYFPVPIMEEQNKIVSIFENIDTLIVNRRQQLLKLDELVKSRFVELFGNIYEPSTWEKKPWSQLVTIQNGRDYKNILVESGGYPVYGTGGEMARAADYLCSENTIIVGRKGTINNPLLVKEKFWNVDTAFGVIVGNQLHYQYFYNFCRMFDFSTLNKQAVLPSTTKADLLKIEIAVPPMELQEQFAAFVEQTDKSKLAIQQSLEQLGTLKKSLMQQYFG